MLFCYIKILLKIIRVKFNSTQIEARAVKKITSYLLIFTVHWIPILIQNLGRLLKVGLHY